MDRLPQELADKLFEYLPLKEVIKFKPLNDQFTAAAHRHIKMRCGSIRLSAFHPLRDSSLRHIFAQIGPSVRNMQVDLIHEKNWVPYIIASCPKLEALQYTHRVDDVCHTDLSGLKLLTFDNVKCSEDMISAFMHNRCRNLQMLEIDGTRFTGRCLTEAPTDLRRLHFTNSKLEFHNIVDYLKTNQKLQYLCIQLDEETADLSVLVEHIPTVKTLGLIGKNIVRNGLEHVAKLTELTKLDVEVNSDNFHQYAEAVDATNQLQELNIIIDDFEVTYKFAESFEKFPRLTKLTVYFCEEIQNAQLLVHYLNDLGKYGKLETLVLAGHTDHLELDKDNTQLGHIKELRVCNPCDCMGEDHLKKLCRFNL